MDPVTDVAPGYREEQRDQPGGFRADPDIFDTWFTSSLTPQISSRWGIDPARHAALFPDQREAIRSAARVSNPGCYASAVALLLRPLIDSGLVDPRAPIAIHAVSGYTGGGRAMIEKWEDPALPLGTLPFEAPYALDRVHKHIPEMVHFTGLAGPPQFVPAVGPYRCEFFALSKSPSQCNGCN